MSVNDSGPGGLFQHFRELRFRVIKSLVFIVVGVMLAFNFYEGLLVILMNPLWRVMPDQGLIYVGLEEAFMVKLKVSVWAGFILSSPFWLHQLWAFLGPALYRREKKWLKGLSALGGLFFFLGAAMAYYLVLPLTIGFFVDQAGPALTPLPAIGSYFTLTVKMILAFGLVFQASLNGLSFLYRAD